MHAALGSIGMAKRKRSLLARLGHAAGLAAIVVVAGVAVLLAIVLSPWGQRRITRELERALARQGIDAHVGALRIDRRGRVILEDIRIASIASGLATAEARRAVVQLRWRALLERRIDLASVDVDEPRIRFDLAAHHEGTNGERRPSRWPEHPLHVRLAGGQIAATGGVNAECGVDADVEVRSSEGRATLPAIVGDLLLRGAHVDDKDAFRALHAHVDLAGDVVRVPLASIETRGGPVTVRDLVVEPMADRIPVRGRVDARSLRFEDVLRAIGVSAHPHVTWSLREVGWDVSGTLSPLSLSGPMDLRTGPFTVFDGACDVESCERIWGFRAATAKARATVTKEGLEIRHLRATVPGGRAEVARALIGFHDQFVIERATIVLDSAQTSPLASLTTSGELRVRVRASGTMSDPTIDMRGTASQFVLDGDPLGDVTSFRARFHHDTLTFEDVRAHKGGSDYLAPALRIAFGPDGRLDVDALASASVLGVRDLLSLVRLDELPRLASLAGTLHDVRARVRYVVHGPEDPRGQGTLFIETQVGLERPSLFGRRFDEGALDVAVRWWDRDAGLAGVDIDLRSLQLRNLAAQDNGGPRAASLMASGRLAAGRVEASAVAAHVPLFEVAPESTAAATIDGSFSFQAHLVGTLDSIRAAADIETTAPRIGGIALGASSLHLEAAFGRRTPLQAVALGQLLGGQVRIEHLVAEGPLVHGRMLLRDLDVGALVRGASRSGSRGPSPPPATQATLSGELAVASLDVRTPWTAVAELVPRSFEVRGAGHRALLRPAGAAVVLAGGTLAVPPLHFDVLALEGVTVSATVSGFVDSLPRAPHVHASLEVPPADLSALVGLVPDLQRIAGTLSVTLLADGPLASPSLGGRAFVRAHTATVRWIPGELRDLAIDVDVEPHRLHVTRATAKLAGGEVAASGSIPVAATSLGTADFFVRGRGMHLDIGPGIDGEFDAQANVRVAAPELAAGRPHAVQVTGVAWLDRVTYRRRLDLAVDWSSLVSSAARRRRHHEEETYDPSRDLVDFRLHLYPRTPVRVENDIASVRLLPEGPSGLWLLGTNQRPVLLGRLRALTGGSLHFRGFRFTIAHATLDFDDPERIDPRIDLVATTEYRRVTQFEEPVMAPGTVPGEWRIEAHAVGSADGLHLMLSSNPPLGEDDIVLLVTVGLTRTELDAMTAATGSLQASAGLEALATLGGADRLVRGVLPIDDFRFGSEYSPRTLRIVPDVVLQKRIGERLEATVTTALTEELDLRGAIEWRVSRTIWLGALWENTAPIPATPVGDLGVDFRWRLEFR
jgi:translocation and assembly module TamB